MFVLPVAFRPEIQEITTVYLYPLMLKATFHLFLPATIALFFSGCIFAPPDGPRLRSEVISAIGPRGIVLDQIEAVDQMGLYRVIDRTQISFNLDEVELYEGAKPGDSVFWQWSEKKGRTIIRPWPSLEFTAELNLYPELSEEGLEYRGFGTKTLSKEQPSTEAGIEDTHLEKNPISIPER